MNCFLTGLRTGTQYIMALAPNEVGDAGGGGVQLEYNLWLCIKKERRKTHALLLMSRPKELQMSTVGRGSLRRGQDCFLIGAVYVRPVLGPK